MHAQPIYGRDVAGAGRVGTEAPAGAVSLPYEVVIVSVCGPLPPTGTVTSTPRLVCVTVA